MSLGPATWDLTAVMLMIGGIQITGFADGDVITFSHLEDLTEQTVGADGAIVFNRLNNKHMDVEIKVLPTSKAYPLIYALLVEQHPAGDGVAIPPLAFICKDTINGETVSSDKAVFTARPAPVMGKTIGERVFKLTLPKAGENMIANVNRI